jgi:hypothetical protein
MRLTLKVLEQLLAQNDGFEANTYYRGKNLRETRQYKISGGELNIHSSGKTSWATVISTRRTWPTSKRREDFYGSLWAQRLPARRSCRQRVRCARTQRRARNADSGERGVLSLLHGTDVVEGHELRDYEPARGFLLVVVLCSGRPGGVTLIGCRKGGGPEDLRAVAGPA